MKKLLILGGSPYIIPVIKKAHELGLYVITCDYLPGNAAHKYSDEYQNISIIDKGAVLQMAIDRQIDGVISFACDPGVVTAAYVAEQMNLPFQCSYESACILQDKGRFRQFLKDNGFNTPHAKRYTDAKEPYKDLAYFDWPVIVKPVDSAGSKGVTKITTSDELDGAIKKALDSSISGAFIIEDFLTFQGKHSSTDSDIDTIHGIIDFITYSDQYFDKAAENPLSPDLIVWPSAMKQHYQDKLTSEIQRVFDLLHMYNGVYNIETCVGNGGKPYIMEISPRGGGDRICELQEMAYGVPLIENEIRKAVGMSLITVKPHPIEGIWCEYVLHSDSEGVLHEIYIDPQMRNKYIEAEFINVKPGDYIEKFTGANKSLGDIFFRFKDREEMKKIFHNIDDWIRIDIRTK